MSCSFEPLPPLAVWRIFDIDAEFTYVVTRDDDGAEDRARALHVEAASDGPDVVLATRVVRADGETRVFSDIGPRAAGHYAAHGEGIFYQSWEW